MGTNTDEEILPEQEAPTKPYLNGIMPILARNWLVLQAEEGGAQ